MLFTDKNVRVQQIRSLTERDEHFMWLMREYPPLTELQHGDICYLRKPTPRLWHSEWFQEHGVPRYWKVQFVISAFQFGMHDLMHNYSFDGDQAYNFLDHSDFNFERARDPIVYAHGFPHGDNPNTAEWFPERVLKRLCLRTQDVDWEPVLDEFQTPFHGYDLNQLQGGFVLDMAPDLYASGLHLGGPLSHEEATFQTASSLGLEQAMLSKETPYTDWDDYMDPEHDVFVHPWG